MSAAGDTLPTRLQRADGCIRVAIKRRGAASVLADLYQHGCGKVRFPVSAATRPFEVVTLNTSGGLTDGDRLRTAVDWQRGSAAIATTQAAERIYRSRGADATIRTTLEVAEGARAIWLPQETIIFDGARLARRTEIDVAPGASLLAAESLVFGRTAMRETVQAGRVADRWRLRIGGRLAFADGFVVDDRRYGSLQAALDRPAIADGAHALATLVLVTPDVARFVAPLRAVFARDDLRAALSLPGDLLVARMLAHDASALRETMIQVFDAIQSLSGSDNAFRDFSLPRVFDC